MRKPRPAAPRIAGCFAAATPLAVDVPAAAVVVYVLVLAGTVVPGIVLPATVEAGRIEVEPATATVEASTVEGATVEGSTVVPGKVVVTVMTWPRAVAGIALTEPAAVNCVGMGRVEVFGLSGESSDPYTLPVVPSVRV